jgi:hypothetical protein
MSEAAVNHYKADLRAIQFTLYEHLKVQQVFELEAFSHISREECDAIIAQCHRFVNDVTGPINGTADRAGCTIEGGQVVTPKGFKDAWKKLFELGLMSFPMPLDDGGLGGPHAIAVVLEELQSGANCAFNMYPGLTHGAADVISSFGLPRIASASCPPMVAGRFRGHHVPLRAARRLGRRRRQDPRQAPRRQRLLHQRYEVLDLGGRPRPRGEHRPPRARPHRGRPPGTQGLSLFIVPKIWVNEDGSLGKPTTSRPRRSSTSSASGPRRRRS